MNNTRFWLAAAIIAGVLLAGFVLSVPHTRDLAQTATTTRASSIPAVTLSDVFKKGTHTITGTVETPNVCTSATAEAALVDPAVPTKGIRVDITLTDDTGVCLQVPTTEHFSAAIAAPDGVPLSATVNGVEATTTSL